MPRIAPDVIPHFARHHRPYRSHDTTLTWERLGQQSAIRTMGYKAECTVSTSARAPDSNTPGELPRISTATGTAEDFRPGKPREIEELPVNQN
jgi:hypothetical protein